MNPDALKGISIYQIVEILLRLRGRLYSLHVIEGKPPAQPKVHRGSRIMAHRCVSMETIPAIRSVGPPFHMPINQPGTALEQRNLF